MDCSDASDGIEGLDIAVFEPGLNYSTSANGLPAAKNKPPRLLNSLRAEIRRRHYSLRTEEAYVGRVWRYILFYGNRHPRA